MNNPQTTKVTHIALVDSPPDPNCVWEMPKSGDGITWSRCTKCGEINMDANKSVECKCQQLEVAKSLKRCPFCNGTPALSTETKKFRSGGNGKVHQIFCMNCFAVIDSLHSFGDAAEAWNKRVT